MPRECQISTPYMEDYLQEMPGSQMTQRQHSAGAGLLRQLQRAKRRICGGTWHQVISHPSQFQQDWIISYCQPARFRSHKDMLTMTMTIMIFFCGYVHISIYIYDQICTHISWNLHWSIIFLSSFTRLPRGILSPSFASLMWSESTGSYRPPPAPEICTIVV